ncbi:hypothetical protein GIS00_23185 [Nakamurella sp. YIM 132087]|uniref:NHLP leader peptide family natural product n=1 Tax=Nakamurella alba TaxID=2665158 RepID=A0A7K1FRS0_9ACTN|nr:hypothetical protein [Nakamurella alba]MTD16842.1 hypothetical protein [Nakamurella alba]
MTITLTDLQTRSATDKDFRDALIADPAAVLAEQGVEIPEGVAVEVHPSTTETLVLTLPPFAGAAADVELSEDDLEGASGGLYMPFPMPGILGLFGIPLGAPSIVTGHTGGVTGTINTALLSETGAALR